MKVLIYSDVHGNLPAFEKMLSIENNIDQFICLGDLVNYGPWSNECVDLALSLPNSSIIMGNHEKAFINNYYPGDNPLVQSFFEICHKNFSKINEIKNFFPFLPLERYTCKHTINNNYVYPDTSIVLDDNYIIGHSHHQFKYASNGYVLYNAGSVGQNREYINEVNYLTYDTDSKIIELKSCLYDLKLLIDKMKDLKYPDFCIEYYTSKKVK